MSIVLDSNVVVSSYLNASGNPAKILAAFRTLAFEVVVSDPLLEEYQRVLSYPRLCRLHSMTDQEIADLVEGIRHTSVVVQLAEIPNVIPEDPADNMVIATAIAGEAEYIISGDDDLHRLSTYQGIRVLSPAAFVALLER